MSSYKPENYNCLSRYLIVDNAQDLVDLLINIFNATELRKMFREDGKIKHVEVKIDDSILMISDSTADYKAIPTILHLYVPDVDKTFDKAIQLGCEIIERPITKPGEGDKRGSFYDNAGNYWSVSTPN